MAEPTAQERLDDLFGDKDPEYVVVHRSLYQALKPVIPLLLKPSTPESAWEDELRKAAIPAKAIPEIMQYARDRAKVLRDKRHAADLAAAQEIVGTDTHV